MSPAESLPVSRRWRSAVRVNLDVVTNRVAPADGRREGVAASDDRVSPCAITITNVAQRQVIDRPAGHDGCGIAHEIEGLHLTHPSRAIRAYTAATNKDFSAPFPFLSTSFKAQNRALCSAATTPWTITLSDVVWTRHILGTPPTPGPLCGRTEACMSLSTDVNGHSFNKSLFPLVKRWEK